MSTDTFSTLAALAAFVAIGIGVIALVGAFRPAVLSPLGPLGVLVRAHPLRIGTALAAGATAGSLYYSEVADFVPCDYCWYQRIAMYPLVFVLGIAAIRGDRGAMYTAVPIAGIGLGIAIYHFQLQLFPDQGSACNLFAPCTQQWVDEFGFVSIPFMAGSAFFAIVALGALCLADDRRTRRSEQEPTSAADGGETGDRGTTSAVVPAGPSTR
ncbi:MAG: disulfide bond formation protein B [Actinomycetota bacterium]